MFDLSSHPKWARLAYVSVAAVALLPGGCLLVAAGAAGGAALGYVYCKGNVCDTYASNFEDSWAATHTALAELSLPVSKEERENLKGWIECRAANGDRVRIYLDIIDSPIPAQGPLTRICVRVATFGDYALSERILNQVGAHLVVVVPPSGPAPPLASPEPPVAPSPPPTTRGASPAPQPGEPPLLTPPVRQSP